MLLISDHVTKKLNKRTLIIKPATPKTFGNIAKVHSNHKAMISSRVLVKTLASNIKKKPFEIITSWLYYTVMAQTAWSSNKRIQSRNSNIQRNNKCHKNATVCFSLPIRPNQRHYFEEIVLTHEHNHGDLYRRRGKIHYFQ